MNPWDILLFIPVYVGLIMIGNTVEKIWEHLRAEAALSAKED